MHELPHPLPSKFSIISERIPDYYEHQGADNSVSRTNFLRGSSKIYFSLCQYPLLGLQPQEAFAHTDGLSLPDSAETFPAQLSCPFHYGRTSHNGTHTTPHRWPSCQPSLLPRNSTWLQITLGLSPISPPWDRCVGPPQPTLQMFISAIVDQHSVRLFA